jgi:hypothetical protein
VTVSGTTFLAAANVSQQGGEVTFTKMWEMMKPCKMKTAHCCVNLFVLLELTDSRVTLSVTPDFSRQYS